MNIKDRIGRRGENIFTTIITRWCDGTDWFSETRLGDKYELLDFLVDLANPSSGRPQFYVQVKATGDGYTGRGTSRKLKIKVSAKHVSELQTFDIPTYIVGIDIHREQGYILSVDHLSGGLNGVPTTWPLDCTTFRKLWKEVQNRHAARGECARLSDFR